MVPSGKPCGRVTAPRPMQASILPRQARRTAGSVLAALRRHLQPGEDGEGVVEGGTARLGTAVGTAWGLAGALACGRSGRASAIAPCGRLAGRSAAGGVEPVPRARPAAVVTARDGAGRAGARRAFRRWLAGRRARGGRLRLAASGLRGGPSRAGRRPRLLVPWTARAGAAPDACESEICFLSRSTLSTRASTRSPGLTTSRGSFTKLLARAARRARARPGGRRCPRRRRSS